MLLQTPAPAPPVPQQDIRDVVRRWLNRPPANPDDSNRRRSILPTIGVTPAGGVAVGVLLSAHGQEAPDARLSVLTANASYSTKERGQIVVRLDHPLSSGDWRLVGDWRFYVLTERTYGLGSDTTTSQFVDVPLTWGRTHSTVYRRLTRAFELGAGYHLDIRQVHDLAAETPQIQNRVTFASGISFDAAFDTRDNIINASRGWLGRTTVTWFPEPLGNDRSWQSIEAEGRGYWRLPSARRQVLATWVLGRFTADGVPDYFDLPSTGWDAAGRSARGYPAGRFRGRSWLDVEAEYRVDLMRNGLVGAVAFTNASTLSDGQDTFGRWQPAAGFGLRLKLDKEHSSNLCVDYAWGRDGSRGLFLSLNEAF
jgi:outer membrane protein assembly factor BamA